MTDNLKRFTVTINYIATDHTEHTIQAQFSSLPMALSKAKSTCLKQDVARVKSVVVKEVQ